MVKIEITLDDKQDTAAELTQEKLDFILAAMNYNKNFTVNATTVYVESARVTEGLQKE